MKQGVASSPTRAASCSRRSRSLRCWSWSSPRSRSARRHSVAAVTAAISRVVTSGRTGTTNATKAAPATSVQAFGATRRSATGRSTETARAKALPPRRFDTRPLVGKTVKPSLTGTGNPLRVTSRCKQRQVEPVAALKRRKAPLRQPLPVRTVAEERRDLIAILGLDQRAGRIGQHAMRRNKQGSAREDVAAGGASALPAVRVSASISPPARAASCPNPSRERRPARGRRERRSGSALVSTIRTAWPPRAARAGRSRIRAGCASCAKTSARARAAMASVLPPPPAQ